MLLGSQTGARPEHAARLIPLKRALVGALRAAVILCGSPAVSACEHQAAHQAAQAPLVEQVLAVAHARWAGLLIGQGEPEAALEHAERAVELDLGSADAHFKLGLACALSEQSERASVELGVALRLQPEHLEARRKLGQAYLAIGRTRSAREQALIVLAHAPHDPLAQRIREQAGSSTR